MHLFMVVILTSGNSCQTVRNGFNFYKRVTRTRLWLFALHEGIKRIEKGFMHFTMILRYKSKFSSTRKTSSAVAA